MGIKEVPVDSLVYVETENIFPLDRIVYPDLVKTLTLNQTKYYRPVLDASGKVIENSIFLKAAVDAGLESILVDTPNGNGDSFTLPADKSYEVLKNYVFFNNPDFDRTNVFTLFETYMNECAEAVLQPTINVGIIFLGNHKIIQPDVLEYVLFGELESSEGKEYLTKPTEKFHEKIAQAVGEIRSVNGIKL